LEKKLRVLKILKAQGCSYEEAQAEDSETKTLGEF
tara:strand:- start:1430 stop:1534 length:105 start_codon:yes stop_codon:yes gene_type:complete